MSNIDKRALREAAERAESDSWGYDRDEFNEALTPSTVLALLDELEESERLRLKFQDANCELCQKLEAAEKTSAARLGAIDTTHKMFQRERERAEEAEKRIAELELKLEAADKLQDSAFRHGLQHGFSYGQTDNQAGFEQAIQAYGQQWKGE